MCASVGLAGGSNADIVGQTDLLRRLGSANAPTGAPVIIGQVEAFPGGTSDYQPDFTLQEFNGKNFTIVSGASGTSTHATIVGRNFYGNSSSIAPDITEVFLYSAGGWIQPNYLRIGFTPSLAPIFAPPGLRIFNNSWIGDFNGGDALDNEAIRRADFAAVRDDVLTINGENNDTGSSNLPLLTHMFNGIAVGRTDGEHSFSDTRATIDGPGRMNPHLVAPGSTTSYATPVVSAGAALMLDAAQSPLSGGANAERSEVIKALLLAGATHEANGVAWTNNPATSGPARGATLRPLDDVFGAGTLNVDRSHFMLAAGEQDGSIAPPNAPNALPSGWDLVAAGQNQVTHWRINLPVGAPEVSIAATWHRVVDQDVDGESNVIYPSWSMADFDLELKRVGAGGAFESMVGDAGVVYFGGGNVLSNSSVDNIEHLYITDLAPGEYVIELRRADVLTDDFDAAIAWDVPRPTDLIFDGSVDVQDLLHLLSEWGPCDPVNGCSGNTNDDDFVDVQDLLRLLGDWG